MTYAEITKEAFFQLVNDDQAKTEVETLEHARKFYYEAHGCRLMIVNNFIGNIFQYYIQDINA